MNNEQPTETLPSVMLKSIASKYEDVVAMVPLTKMDPSILHKLFKGVMNAITTMIQVIIPTSFIPHLLDQH